ncbi:hypothetical protein [Spirosoma endophyticum]|uniref:GNAT family N-acetyltransferase n=1 Tax=Spirosoma endophyticum TaxID=662367 RepID=A0A1I2HQW8_9BACT|nr:hypothetical protein [Spirosoma endophyticum]SFF32239.1 hypothetical protein SAMN05216167_14710 [Spirosoma endophyticum]
MDELELPTDPSSFVFKGILRIETGERMATHFVLLTDKSSRQIKKTSWVFDWQRELKQTDRHVYKLVMLSEPDTIQGLISLSFEAGYIFVQLIENAAFNRGEGKVFDGVVGNLLTFACLLSVNSGFEGFVAFDSKSELIRYYQQNYGAIRIGGIRMAIDEHAAHHLINKYYKA